MSSLGLGKVSDKFYDIVIVGGGIVGLTAGLALAKQTQLKIAILDSNALPPGWIKKNYDHRVSAISPASKKIFRDLNVWESIVRKRISPYTKMQVWDAEEKSEIYFDAADVNESALGFIIEDSVMRTSLLEEIRQYPQVDLFFSCQVTAATREIPVASRLLPSLLHVDFFYKNQALRADSASSPLASENPDCLKARLVIAADGANSLVRDLMGISLKTWDYEHTALVTTVETKFSHQHTAWQRFLPTGPLAFLPLENDKQCSIVWSTSPAQAEHLLSLSEQNFCEQLTGAFKNTLGAVSAASQRYHFSLRMRHAKNYVQENVALIGDAAHTIHPLAGQGVNLGLLDAICLTDIIIDAVKKNRNFSSLATLRRYERARKSDNLMMLAGVEILKQLFSTENNVVQHIRNAGMNFSNRSQWLKKFFVNYALGYR